MINDKPVNENDKNVHEIVIEETILNSNKKQLVANDHSITVREVEYGEEELEVSKSTRVMNAMSAEKSRVGIFDKKCSMPE